MTHPRIAQLSSLSRILKMSYFLKTLNYRLQILDIFLFLTFNVYFYLTERQNHATETETQPDTVSHLPGHHSHG